MELTIPQEFEAEDEYVVEEQYTAPHVGSRDLAVLATPSMIMMMERTVRIAVEEHLPDEYTTVGTEVCIKHLAPAPKGGKVKVMGKLLEQEGRKLKFHVEAWWKDVKIGEGTHERFIVNRHRFMERLKQKMEQS